MTGTLHKDQRTFTIPRSVPPKMWNVPDKSWGENKKNAYLLSITPPRRYCGKMLYNRTGHRWQYNTAHALFMLDNQGYRHTQYVILIAFQRQQAWNDTQPMVWLRTV